MLHCLAALQECPGPSWAARLLTPPPPRMAAPCWHQMAAPWVSALLQHCSAEACSLQRAVTVRVLPALSPLPPQHMHTLWMLPPATGCRFDRTAACGGAAAGASPAPRTLGALHGCHVHCGGAVRWVGSGWVGTPGPAQDPGASGPIERDLRALAVQQWKQGASPCTAVPHSAYPFCSRVASRGQDALPAGAVPAGGATAVQR